MSNQLQITGGAKVRNLEGVLTGTSGVVSSLGINVPSGIPQLDGSGKILVSQLPNSVMEYKGTWDASTNTPTLVDGTGNAGDVYLCNVAGTVNFGAGPITFYVGDQVLYSGTVWQRASGATGSVTSVALTESGDALNITGSPITTSGTINIGFNGTSGQYINGAGNLTTFPSLTGYVPYSGATQSVILGEWGLRSGYLSLDTTPTGTPTTVGTMSWDTTYLTPSVITGTGNTTLQIGQEEVVLIHNNTGSTLTDGQVVYINGSTGNLPTVALADASDESTSAATLGVVTETIANGSDGFITISGNVNGLNTLAYTAGDILWLSETAGQFTNVKPISPAHLVLIGYVVKVSGGNGSILVKIQNTQELEECSDVLFTSLTNNDVLAYESSTDLWKNKSIPTVLGYTPLSGGGTAGNIPYYTGTYTLGSENGFMYDSSTNRFGVNTTVPNATIGANASIDSGYSLLLKNADANYNGLGFGLDSTYGNIITTQKIGTAAARNFTLQNQSGYVSIDESGNFGVNILTPKGGVDIYSSTTAALYLHNSASGVAATDGVRLSLNSTNANLRNYEAGTLSMTSEGDFSVITAATENFRVNSSDGSIYQSKVANAMLKSVSGVITAAVAGTDYLDPSSLSGYVPTSRNITINGDTQNLAGDRSWNVGTITGGGASGRLAFWNGSTSIASDSVLNWDDTNNRLLVGTSTSVKTVTIYSSTADSQLIISGNAPSVNLTEALSGTILYQAKFGLATAANNYSTGSVAGDFVISSQTGSTIFAYNSTEAMRVDTSRNVGIGGIARSGYRLHVYDTAPLLGIESTTTGNVALRFLQAGTVVSGITYFNSDSTLRITNNNGGVRIGTSGLDPALTIASTGAATFSSNVQLGTTTATSTTTPITLSLGGTYGTTLANGTKIKLFDNGTVGHGIGVIAGNLYLNTNDATTEITLNTNNSERMRITSNGRVSIGNTAGNSEFTVSPAGSGATPSREFNVNFDIAGVTRIFSYNRNTGALPLCLNDPGGNVGIGITSNINAKLTVNGGISLGNGWGTSGATLEMSCDNVGSGGANLSVSYWGSSSYGPLKFVTGNAERMRIDGSGAVVLQKYLQLYCSTGSQDALYIQNTSNNTSANAVIFRGWNNSTTGSIATYVNLTTYNTSSDYRLKEDLKQFNGLDVVSKLKMYDFKWKEADWRMYGGLAHEISEVVPYAVNGEKDAVDEEGNIKAQGVDYSTLVPLLIKAIQEQQEQINELKSLINK